MYPTPNNPYTLFMSSTMGWESPKVVPQLVQLYGWFQSEPNATRTNESFVYCCKTASACGASVVQEGHHDVNKLIQVTRSLPCSS